MKIAHIAIVTPRRCGLYETTRELVAAERALGVDARIVDPAPMDAFKDVVDEDRGAPLAGMDWAVTADLVVSHSGHDGTPVGETDQPIIHVAHGRPLSTFLGERDGKAAAYTYQATRSKEDRYRGCVTFWPEYEPYLRPLWAPKPVHVVPPPVDLDYWKPGESGYDFAGQAGDVNVVVADPWSRADVSPLHAVHSFALFRHIVPGAKLHIYAHDGNPKGLQAISIMLGGSLGVVQKWAADLRSVYRAADMLITPHRIYTRSIREAMACGLPVVSGKHVHPEDVEGFALAMARAHETRDPQRERRRAGAEFSSTAAARDFLWFAKNLVGEGVACGD